MPLGPSWEVEGSYQAPRRERARLSAAELALGEEHGGELNAEAGFTVLPMQQGNNATDWLPLVGLRHAWQGLYAVTVCLWVARSLSKAANVGLMASSAVGGKVCANRIRMADSPCGPCT